MNETEAAQEQKRQRIKRLWSGYAASTAVGLFSVVVTPWLLEFFSRALFPKRFQQMDSVLGFTMFIAIPLSMGMVSAWIWRPLKLSGGEIGKYSLCNTCLAIVGSAFVLREGAICLIMASPLLLLVIWMGCALGNLILERTRGPLRMSLLPLFAACLFYDASSGRNGLCDVTDSVRIKASPTQVWHAVNTFPPITGAPDYWLFRLGLPMPVQSKLEGRAVGAKRECILTGPLVFEEKVVAWKPREQLTFDITHQPDHPELTGHFKLTRGEFRLIDNKDGTTTLIGTSWYRLAVRPLWYFEMWADDAIRHIHLRVMNHIANVAQNQALAEKTRKAPRMSTHVPVISRYSRS